MLNVCLLNDSFPPLIDGVANTVVNYAGIINEKYGKSIVAVPNYPNVKDDYPYEVIRYPSIDTSKLVGYRTGVPSPNSLLGRIKDKNVDIIHTHCPAASTIAARLIREGVNAPIVMTYHTKFDIDIEKAVKGKLLQEAAIKIFAANVSACDEVWTVSKGAGENLRSLGYKGDYYIMKNGVDFPRSRVSEANVDALAKGLSIDRKYPVFLFVGRMMWYKGCKLTLDSLAKIKNDGYKFKMIFVGDGTDKQEIMKYSNMSGLVDDCIFTGPVHDRELLKTYFCLADLFLFPSTFDTNGIVVREAAACSLGSMIIKGSCAAEDISDCTNGILIDENVESMASAIENACDNIPYLRKIGDNASKMLYMSWEDSVAAAVERYQVVIDKYKSKGKTNDDGLDELLSLIAKNYDKTQEFKKKFKAIIDNKEITDRYL